MFSKPYYKTIVIRRLYIYIYILSSCVTITCVCVGVFTSRIRNKFNVLDATTLRDEPTGRAYYNRLSERAFQDGWKKTELFSPN